MSDERHYNGVYKEFRRRGVPPRWFAHDLESFVVRFFREHNVKTVLDVGCGTGKQVNQLNSLGFSAVGVDFSSEAVSIGKELYGAPISVARADSLPFPDKSFDGFYVSSVLRNTNPKKALFELRRVARVGFLRVALEKMVNDVHCVFWSEEELNSLLESFKVVDSSVEFFPADSPIKKAKWFLLESFD